MTYCASLGFKESRCSWETLILLSAPCHPPFVRQIGEEPVSKAINRVARVIGWISRLRQPFSRNLWTKKCCIDASACNNEMYVAAGQLDFFVRQHTKSDQIYTCVSLSMSRRGLRHCRLKTKRVNGTAPLKTDTTAAALVNWMEGRDPALVLCGDGHSWRVRGWMKSARRAYRDADHQLIFISLRVSPINVRRKKHRAARALRLISII